MKNNQQKIVNFPVLDTEEWISAYNFLSDMIANTVVVFDFDKKTFKYIPNDYVQNTPIEVDYEHVKNIIHPNDVSFLDNVYTVILDSLNNEELMTDHINYFSFILQIRKDWSLQGKSDYLMTYVKLKPQWVNGLLKYGICMLSASIIRKQDNQLCAHYKCMDYFDYSFKTKKWTHIPFSPLSKREKEMLIWAQQGLSLKETAIKMNVADKTIENMRYTLFAKFGVNTIEQAIQYAFNRRLLYNDFYKK